MAFQEALVLERERVVAERAEKAAAEVGRALLLKAAKEKQRQEAVGRTRLGESKEEMLRRLTAVAAPKRGGRRRSEDDADATATATATATAEPIEEEGWTKVGH